MFITFVNSTLLPDNGSPPQPPTPAINDRNSLKLSEMYFLKKQLLQL